MQKLFNIVGLLVAVLFVAPQSAVTQSPPASTAGTSPLRPGDGIRVRVYGDSVLNGEFSVDDRGIVVLPKLGEWSVVGMPADSVRSKLVAALQVYLKNSSIEAVPFRRIAVVGAVMKPGLYPVDAGMSVADALILAQGPSSDANRQGTAELRVAGATAGRSAPMEARVWSLNPAAGEQLVVPQASWIQRHGVQALTLVLSVVSTISIIILQARR